MKQAFIEVPDETGKPYLVSISAISSVSDQSYKTKGFCNIWLKSDPVHGCLVAYTSYDKLKEAIETAIDNGGVVRCLK